MTTKTSDLSTIHCATVKTPRQQAKIAQLLALVILRYRQMGALVSGLDRRVGGVLMSTAFDDADQARRGKEGYTRDQLTVAINYSQRYFTLEGGVNLGDGITGTIHLEGATSNQVPWVDAGPPQLLHCAHQDGAAVQLDGRVVDPDSDNAPQWSMWVRDDGQIIAFNDLTPTVTLPIGLHQLTLYVADGGTGAQGSVTVEVVEPCL